MDHALVALALNQIDSDNSQMWIIIGVVLVLLFLVVVVIAIAVVIFIVMRRKKAQQLAGPSATSPAPSLPETASAPAYTPQTSEPATDYSVPATDYSAPATDYSTPATDYSAPAADYSTPAAPPIDASAAAEETRWPSVPEPTQVDTFEQETQDFDPSRTVAIVREPATVEINYGKIKFVSGVLAGEEFVVEADGAYIGREAGLCQIVISDPRISKRHLWIGVRDGEVTIVDQESRNGTFINDPRSDRIHEAKLNSGDTVIMGESDVARFEYHS